LNTLLKSIPNAITLGNIFCGCLALIAVFNKNYEQVAFFVFLAGLLDFFDGFAARMLKAHSAIGKDLDSLADVVTFGVVPGVLWFQILGTLFTSSSLLPYLAFAIPLSSALRLAKFNNDSRQSSSFIGLPTPANAFFLCFLPLTASSPAFNHTLGIWLTNPYIALFIVLFFAGLLNSPIPLFALKVKSLKAPGNRLQLVFLTITVALLSLYGYFAIPIVILLYIFLSIIFFKKP
jgi:CDP-diacylglycerol--serine O-phosphatidyltransferase